VRSNFRASSDSKFRTKCSKKNIKHPLFVTTGIEKQQQTEIVQCLDSTLERDTPGVTTGEGAGRVLTT
jgi:hypothetical protein